MSASCRHRFRHLTGALALLAGLVANPTEAGTLVRVGTSLGDFTIELLDDTAPVTVQNFLNYVTRGDYDQTYINRLERSFVIQGGGYRFQPFVGPIDVPADPPIVNEFKVSNTRGTLAMAKLENQPDSATNQWFINLVDNSSSLDPQNGGFTVFGTVLGNGMAVVDAIASLPFVSLGAKASSAPFITDSFTSPTQFVYVKMDVVDRFSDAANVFEAGRGLLFLSVNVDNGAERWSVNLQQVSDGSNGGEVAFQVDSLSVIRLRANFEGHATYATSDQRLRIPALEVNWGDRVQVVQNVVMRMTDATALRFTLESFQP